MKTKRNLSGIYFRCQNEDTGKWENVCFEDLPEVKQDEILFKNDNIDWTRSLAKSLAMKLHDIGEQFDIISE